MNDLRAATPPRGEDLRLALVLGLLGAIAIVLLFPYLLATMPQVLEKASVPLPVLAGLQAAQGFVLLGLLAYIGLRLGHSTGLGAPWLRALVMRRPRSPQASASATSSPIVSGSTRCLA